MIPAVDNIWYFVIPIALFGVAQGINIPSILNLLTGFAPKDFRAAFLSINWMVMRIGQALGPYLLGLAYLYINVEGTFYFTALTAAIFVLVSFFVLQDDVLDEVTTS
jgi:sugar phosphate permease